MDLTVLQQILLVNIEHVLKFDPFQVYYWWQSFTEGFKTEYFIYNACVVVSLLT